MNSTEFSPLKPCLILLAVGIAAAFLQAPVSRHLEERKAKQVVQESVERVLVAPASAKYHLQASHSSVTGYVDSQNAFGALLREQIRATAYDGRVHQLTLGDRSIIP